MSDFYARSFDKFIGSKGFADPFMLPSSEWMPNSFGPDTFDFCVYLYGLNGAYQHAADRVIAHFITDIEFSGRSGDPKEQADLRAYLWDQLQLFEFQREIGQDFNVYGNGLAWIFFPYNRYLTDHRDDLKEYPLSIFPDGDVRYLPKELMYEVTDPATFHLPAKRRKRMKFKFRDRKVMDTSRIRLRKLDPRHVIIDHAICSGQSEYIWRFDPEMLNDIHNGRLRQVNDTPLPMLEAIAKDQDFRFGPDQIFHFKAPTISGLCNSGWGLPEILMRYRNLHMLQVYRKYDEAVAMDYVMPFRILTPNISPDKVGENATMTLMSKWRAQMSELVRRRRADPFHIHALPLPVNMQQFGHEGAPLANHENYRMQEDSMLNSMGFPGELFRGSMAVQVIPATVRLFENHFFHVYGSLNRMTQWVVRRILDWRNAEPQQCRQMRPSMADDLEKRNIIMQLIAGGELPRDIGYRLIGVNDPVDAHKRRAQEDVEIAKIQEQIQKDYEREQQLGSMTDQLAQAEQAGGGAAGGAPAGAHMTPLDRGDQVEQEALNLLAIPDQGTRTKALMQMKAGDPQLYALVKQRMEEIRAQNASQGKAQTQQMAEQAVQTGMVPQ